MFWRQNVNQIAKMIFLETIFEIWKHQCLYFMFSLLRFIWQNFDVIIDVLVFDVIKGLCYCTPFSDLAQLLLYDKFVYSKIPLWVQTLMENLNLQFSAWGCSSEKHSTFWNDVKDVIVFLTHVLYYFFFLFIAGLVRLQVHTVS